MESQKLLLRTHFEKKLEDKSGKWLWYWRTVAPNTALLDVGGKGYHSLVKALNGFFDKRNTDYEPGQPHIPEDYAMEKFANDHYVITHYEEEK